MIQKISLFKSSLLFIGTSLFIYVNLYYFAPLLLDRGISFLAAYLILFYTPFVMMLSMALFLYRKEGGSFNIRSICSRFRIKKLSGKDLILTIILLSIGLTLYLLALPVGKYLASIDFFRPPDFFPAEINPNKEMLSGIFMDTQLKGEYWLIIVYFAGWIFNILGEELLWRGYLLPRQELTHGKYAWVIHGSMWTLWHWFWKWNLLSIMPLSFLLSYAVQKRANTSIGIFAHGFMNFVPLIMITLQVLG